MSKPLLVPYSERAMFGRAAGRVIKSYRYIEPLWVEVTLDDDSTFEGTPSELLPLELREVN